LAYLVQAVCIARKIRDFGVRQNPFAWDWSMLRETTKNLVSGRSVE